MNRFLLLVLSLALPASAFPDEWPRFRGPNGTGIASGKPIPLEWSATENVAWKTELPGPGSSSPIVWGDRVYVTCYTGYGDGSESGIEELRRHLVAINRETGAILWTTATGPDPLVEDPYEGYINEHGYASNTPATDGERIYCFHGKAGVYAFDWDGEQVWHAPTGDLHSQKRWGSASSVILHEDTVIVKAGDEARAILAFDADTGEEKWRAEGSVLEQTYGTPALHRVDEERTDLIVAGTGEVWGVNPATGKLRWFSSMGLTGNISSSPVIADDRVYLFGGFPRTMGLAMQLGNKGDASGQALLWENAEVAAYMTAPILHEGHLYFIRDNGIACCADPVKGELLYEERLPFDTSRLGKGQPFYASPVLANGHLVIPSRRAGTFVIAARPEFEVVAINYLDGDDGRFQGTPAVSDGDLFLRSETALYRISKME